MYDASLILDNKKLRPSERKVRNELVANKADWQYQLSARCLQLAISDLGKAWKNFFDKAQPDWVSRILNQRRLLGKASNR